MKLKNRASKLSLNKRLVLIPMLVFIPMAIVVSYLLISLSQLSDLYTEITRNINVASEYATEVKVKIDHSAYIAVTQNKGFDYIVKNKKNDSELVNPYDYIDKIGKNCSELSKSATIKQSRVQVDNLQKSLQSLQKCLQELEEMIQRGDTYDEQLKYLDDNIYNITNMITEEINSYILSETTNYTTAQEVMRERTNDAYKIAIIASLVAIFIAIVMSVYALRSVTVPITKLCHNIRKVGRGDFNIKKQPEVIDEIAVLTDSFDNMTKEIAELVDEIKKEQDSIRLAQLKLLQEQITPHFLYNTLDAIVWLAEENKTKDVINMVTALSDFFRTGLSEGRDIISIKEEVGHINSYLQIQRYRYQDIMDYEINVDDNIYYYHIPKMTLQPLVENALYHGIKNKRGEGKILVEGHLEDEFIIIEVKDNGKGMDEQQLGKLRNKLEDDKEDESNKGYGLVNVNKRMKYYYGDDCGLFFESELNKGTKAVLRIKTKEIIPIS